MTTILDELCRAGRHLADLGMSPGSSGNISVLHGSDIFLTPSGGSLASVTASGLSRMEMTDEGLVHRSGPKPSKEHGLHDALYRRGPSVRCVIHLHSPYAVAVSCLPPWAPHSALPPLTPYMLMRVGNLPMLPYAPPGDPRQATALRRLDIDCHGALLQNHGPVVAGASVEEAVLRAIEIEQASRVVLAVGERPHARVLSEEEIDHLTSTYGQPWGLPTTV